MAHQLADLAPGLARADDLPVGVQLAWRLRVLIASGALGPGDRLPGVRELAAGTEVNVNTARAVYRRLEEDGLIVSRQGDGTFVAADADAVPALGRLAGEAVEAARAAGIDPRELARAIYAGTPGDDAAAALAEDEATTDRLAGLDLDLELPTTETEAGRRAARRTLRAQIARLEAELAAYPEEARGRRDETHPLLRPKAHVAGFGELEATRDELLERLKRARAEAEREAQAQGRARERLAEMARDPAAHKWEAISQQELGEAGCSTYDVRPAWGPVGALMNWWRIRVSGGCPLAASA